MADRSAFAVFLHQQAIDALGAAIKPYLIDSPAGPHLQCVEVDGGGALFEMTLVGKNAEGRAVEVELMLPIGMVKLVVQKRKARLGRNPATGEPIKIPAKTVVKARIIKQLKDSVLPKK